jgi:hypothetical protein
VLPYHGISKDLGKSTIEGFSGFIVVSFAKI